MITVLKLEYRTKQQDLLIEFLKKADRRHFTAAEISEHFKDFGIGKATVYRQLEKLVDSGEVNKFFTGENAGACFEFVGGKHEEGGCFHCRCEICGKLIHLHCDEISQVTAHMEKEHGFEINPFRTVFYGTCAECREKEVQGAS